MDEDFILDRFNLTGLNNEVANYSQALDLITDTLGALIFAVYARIRKLNSLIDADDDIQDDLRGSLDVQARLLYGLIHARWIVTARGLQKMVCLKSENELSAYLNPSSKSTSVESSAAAPESTVNLSLSYPLG